MKRWDVVERAFWRGVADGLENPDGLPPRRTRRRDLDADGWYDRGVSAGQAAVKACMAEEIVPEASIDRAFLGMAEGATFQSTKLPSGWTTPDRRMVARSGVLVPAPEEAAAEGGRATGPAGYGYYSYWTGRVR